MQTEDHPHSQDSLMQQSHEPYWCRDHHGKEYTFDQALEWIRSFHGHTAPGLVIGLKMVTVAMARLPEDVLFDVVCETRSCLPDAVQMLTLCTIGNNWLKLKDIKRFAVILYDKSNGKGVRVFLDPEKLKHWPEFFDWFYKRKTRKEQNFEQLMREIHNAGSRVLTHHDVQILPQYLVKQSKGQIGTCPMCGEAYPLMHGSICKGCQGEAPFEPI